MSSVRSAFDLTGRVAIITGGAGLLGGKHAEAIAEMGGLPVLLDIRAEAVAERAETIHQSFGVSAMGLVADVTRADEIRTALDRTLGRFGRVDILINNATNNPKVGDASAWSRLENFLKRCGSKTCRLGSPARFCAPRPLALSWHEGAAESSSMWPPTWP